MDTNFIFVSFFWGMIGTGYFIYGKKQAAAVPMIGGVVLMAISYFIQSAMMLSLVSIGVILSMHWIMRDA